MFERFTDGTRRVIVMAQEESRELGHGYIGGEHLLLGLLRENGAGTAASALGVTLAQARREVRALVPTSRSKRSGHIPFTEQAKKILELSGREAPFGHAVGPVDVLIAVLGEPDGHAAEVLAALGVDRQAARRRTIALAAAEPASRPGGREPIDLRKATDMIVVTAGRNPDVAEEHMQLLGDGLVHVDYGEADQVFLVQVTRIPRVRLLDVARPLGVFDDGMEVWLAGVTVDNYVTVTLEGRGAAAQAALQPYRDQRATAGTLGGAAPGGRQTRRPARTPSRRHGRPSASWPSPSPCATTWTATIRSTPGRPAAPGASGCTSGATAPPHRQRRQRCTSPHKSIKPPLSISPCQPIRTRRRQTTCPECRLIAAYSAVGCNRVLQQTDGNDGDQARSKRGCSAVVAAG